MVWDWRVNYYGKWLGGRAGYINIFAVWLAVGGWGLSVVSRHWWLVAEKLEREEGREWLGERGWFWEKVLGWGILLGEGVGHMSLWKGCEEGKRCGWRRVEVGLILRVKK
jgi:hypothetical protein